MFHQMSQSSEKGPTSENYKREKKPQKKEEKRNASLLGIILLLNYAAAPQEITLSDLVKVFYLKHIFL